MLRSPASASAPRDGSSSSSSNSSSSRSPGAAPLSPRAAALDSALAPPPRTWLVDSAVALPPAHAPPPLTVIQWNVLQDAPGDFQFLSSAHGAWAHRGPLVLAELRAHAPDVAGLQEVSHIGALQAELSHSHFVLFAPKLEAAAGDGCALLLSRARFRVMDVNVLYYAAAAAEEGGGAAAPAPLSNQNAILVTALDVLAARWVVLAVTHLKASQTPAAERARLAQVEQLAAAARSARVRAEEASGAAPGTVPVVLVGDFNAFPGHRPYHALLTLLPDLASAYNTLERAACEGPAQYAEGEPAFTTYKFRQGVEKRETEDYIFFTAGRGLVRRALLRLPSIVELGEGRGMPNRLYPSDHCLLGCQFVWGEAAEA
jgi:endonuclease/exonuclease/phosphatase family metal-dependent hydrolase